MVRIVECYLVIIKRFVPPGPRSDDGLYFLVWLGFGLWRRIPELAKPPWIVILALATKPQHKGVTCIPRLMYIHKSQWHNNCHSPHAIIYTYIKDSRTRGLFFL